MHIGFYNTILWFFIIKFINYYLSQHTFMCSIIIFHGTYCKVILVPTLQCLWWDCF